MFLLSGIVDILVIFLKFPVSTSKLFLTLASTTEATLIYIHSQMQDEFNILLHSILAFVALVCAVFSLLRLASSTNIVVNLGLGSCILLQGTWLLQVTTFLYDDFLKHHGMDASHPNAMSEHRLRMFLPGCFALHVIGIAVGNLCLWAVLSAVVKKGCFPANTSVNVEERGKLLVDTDVDNKELQDPLCQSEKIDSNA